MFDYKKLAVLGLGIFAVALSFFVLISKGVGSIRSLYKELADKKQEVKILKDNIETLKKVDLTMINKSEHVFMTLPDRSFVPLLISNIKSESTDKILIKTIKSENVNSGENIPGINLIYEAEAEKMENIFSFAEALQKYVPITVFNKIDISAKDGKYDIGFEAATYWAELPKDIPQVDSVVNNLTDEETKLLNEIAGYKLPTGSSLNPQGPSDRPNPFI